MKILQSNQYSGNRYPYPGRSRIATGYWILITALLGLAALLLSSCQPKAGPDQPPLAGTLQVTPEEISVTPMPERAKYQPGQLVDYIAQTGDTLPALAIHFNTTVEEILEANSYIPPEATTLPPGMPMQIPIYYKSFWGTPFKILPDSLFINGPAQLEFDTQAFVDEQPGWLRNYQDYVAGTRRTGAGIIDYVAQNFSISPRVLLALLEYQTGALSQANLPTDISENYPLGQEQRKYRGLYLQLVWAANTLNNGYYGWRTGHLTTIEIPDGTIEHPDPWQTAASVAFQYYFSVGYSGNHYQDDIGPEGLAQVYRELFGDPWRDVQTHIPGSLQQPQMYLPFEPGKTWAYTGGPHTGWGTGEPWSAIDFAPAGVRGCSSTNEWTTATTSGVVTRSETGILEIDADGDGDPRTGWTIFYLHIASHQRAPVGTVLEAGDKIGHPSCEGGTSTGTHIHIARKFNGEWIAAEGPLGFDLEGWIVHNGDEPYQGSMTRYSNTVVANVNANFESFITAAERLTE